jgi:basic membrane lipoprotein Med (substrate-binding protein (PBP1-ABC) superfamily)
MVGGVAIPPVRGTFQAFEAGARALNPQVQVLESFIGNWEDVGAAKEAAVAQLNRGADVLIHNADAAAFGVFHAVREAVQSGDRVWALGMNRDQAEVAPDVILGSAVLRIPQAFLDVARAWQAGTWNGEPVLPGEGDDLIDFIVNPALADQIPAELLERMEEARMGIRDGSVVVPRLPFGDG